MTGSLLLAMALLGPAGELGRGDFFIAGRPMSPGDISFARPAPKPAPRPASGPTRPPPPGEGWQWDDGEKRWWRWKTQEAPAQPLPHFQSFVPQAAPQFFQAAPSPAFQSQPARGGGGC